MRMSIDAENLLSTPLPMRSLRQSAGASSKLHINPSVLVIVIILSVVFLCSGILHILARCLGRRRARQPSGPGGASGSSPSNSLRGQLQHLFSLHDSGVEQVFIDTLPVFLYGSIRGLKDSADCAVCLTEFANEDKLRLLPKCKHAFHTECIDTWLLSNSTCPLCRRSLLPDPVVTPCAPTNNQALEQPNPSSSFRGSFRASLRGSFRFLTESVTPAPPAPPARDPAPPAPEPTTPPMTPGPTVSVPQPDGSEKTLRVELGRVNVDRITASTSRMARSYSMGSYEYVVDFASFGLAELAGLQRPTHRATLSDGIPELSSAGHTPGQEDLFWASRGLDTPHSLSRVREIMTPSPGWNSSPLFLASQQQKQKKQQQHDDEDDEGEEEGGGEIKALTRVKKLSPNPNSRTSVEMVEISPVATTDMFVEKQGGKEDVTRLKKLSPNPNSRTSVEMVEVAGGGESKALTRLKKELKPSPNSRTSVEMVEGSAAASTDMLVEKQDGEEEDEEVLKGKEEALLPRSLSLALMRSPTQELGAASRKDKVWEVSVDVSEPERSPSSKKSSPLNWLRGRGRRLVYSAASPSANDLQQQQQ